MAYKILSVDDSRTIRMIVKKAFSAYECDLVEAENGSEGLALAAKEKPDLIVLDITMPVMTGIEMLNRLKEVDELKNIPVIMLTAESGKDNVMNIVKMGVKDYIVKPFKGEQLIDRAKNILNLKPRIENAAQGEDNKDADVFSAAGDIVVLTLPKKVSRSVAMQIEEAAKSKIGKLGSAGARKIILNLNKVVDLNMTTIQLVIDLVNLLVRAKLIVRILAPEQQKEALMSFRETGSIPTFSAIDDLKNSF